MLGFALHVCYSVTTREDESQNALVGNLKSLGSILDNDLLFSSYTFHSVHMALSLYIDCCFMKLVLILVP